MNPKRGKTALVADIDGWVLRALARAWAEELHRLGHEAEIILAPERRRDWLRMAHGWDLVHFFSPWDFVRFVDLTFAPAMLTVHHLTEAGEKAIRPALRKAAAVCVINGAMLRRMNAIRNEDKWSAPIYRMDNGLNPADFEMMHVAVEDRDERERFVMGFVGKKTSNDDSRKGLDRLWRVMDNSCIELCIFGPVGKGGWGKEDVPVRLQHRVSFAGYLSYADYLNRLGALDGYLCLSRVEGGPYPVLEAMASGVPVIATPVGIVPELIQHGQNGFIVSGQSDDEVCGWVRALIQDRAMAVRVGEEGRRTVLQQYSWTSVFSRQTPAAIHEGAICNMRGRRRFLDRLRQRIVQMAGMLAASIHR